MPIVRCLCVLYTTYMDESVVRVYVCVCLMMMPDQICGPL